MINGNYKASLAIYLQKGLVENLFSFSPFETLKELNANYEILCRIYKENMPVLMFSADKDYKVTNEQLTEISALIGSVITCAMTAHADEINKGGKQRTNVVDSLMLAKEHLTKLRELINEAKTK